MIQDCTKAEIDFVKKNICPDCKCKGFFEGPHGGLCVNVMCKNPRCGSRFNLGPLTVERISKPHPLSNTADL